MKQFPKGFLWGASTSAYQVEGDLHTQWSEWEKTNADRLAQESPKKLAWMPHQDRIQLALADPQNYISGRGVEHYERYEADFDILQQLHMNAFRFGVEWARLEPEEGKWDEAAVEHYRSYIAALKARGIEPVLTLWHWTMPVWFTGKGAFEKRANLHYFERFVHKIAQEFGGELTYALTLNEPNVYTAFSYMTGEWPPESKRKIQGLKVYRNLVIAHRQAYGILKTTNPKLQVSIAMNMGNLRASNSRNPINRLVVHTLEYAWNWYFLNRVRHQLDFIGMNNYNTEYRDWRGKYQNPAQPVNDLGWYMEPAGLEELIVKVHRRYSKPVLITENGLADSTDEHRQWWLQETLRAMENVLAKDIDLIGYMHWSLLDNFEWAYGWWPKFGLVAVDRHTMHRTVRSSAKWFATEIEKRR